MSWYDKSRAADDDVLNALPTDIFLIHDGDELVDWGWTYEESIDKVHELGGEAELATYVMDTAGSTGKGTSGTYYNSFPESFYPVFNPETRAVDSGVTSYDRANSVAVDAGDDFVFAAYVRHDRTFIREASDEDKRRHGEDVPFMLNISGDRYDPVDRMAPDALRAHQDATERTAD